MEALRTPKKATENQKSRILGSWGEGPHRVPLFSYERIYIQIRWKLPMDRRRRPILVCPCVCHTSCVQLAVVNHRASITERQSQSITTPGQSQSQSITITGNHSQSKSPQNHTICPGNHSQSQSQKRAIPINRNHSNHNHSQSQTQSQQSRD